MILKNPNMFEEDYVPDTIIGRNSEIREIVGTIQPLLEKMKSDNLFIYGPTGVGKTLCVTHVLKNLSETSSKVTGVYINCWVQRTRSAVLYEIIKSVGDFSPRRGLSGDEIMEELNKCLSSYWGVVVVLDEIDKTKDKEVIYDLLRVIKTRVVIIGLSNLESFEIDNRIISVYSPRKIEFKKYSMEEIKDILKERAKQALYPGTYDEEVVGLCAAVGYNSGGDARIALKMLFSSAKEAQNKNLNKIDVSIVQTIKEKTVFIRRDSADLEGLEKDIYDFIGTEKTSKEIENQFPQVTGRTIRNILKKLSEKNMVKKIQFEGKGNRFRYVKVV